MYRVVKGFFDLKDDKHAYSVGDVYPRNGYAPTEVRIAELSSAKNVQGEPLIAEVKEKPVKKAKVEK